MPENNIHIIDKLQKLKISAETFTEKQNVLLNVGLSADQAETIMLNVRDIKTLDVLLQNINALLSKFTVEQIQIIASQSGGYKIISTLLERFDELTTLGFTPYQIARIACQSGGSNNIEAVIENFAQLIPHYSIDEITVMAASNQGSKRVLLAIEHLNSSSSNKTLVFGWQNKKLKDAAAAAEEEEATPLPGPKKEPAIRKTFGVPPNLNARFNPS